MANTITPETTNLAASGRTLKINSNVEFSVGKPTTTGNRTPLINLIVTSMPYNQMLDYSLDVSDGEEDANIWEAPAEGLRARTVIIECEYGGGAFKINPETDTVAFPIVASTTLGNGFFIYTNPSGLSVPLDQSTTTGPGIQKITVTTAVDSRFKIYIFI
jgi:hypothetical protein